MPEHGYAGEILKIDLSEGAVTSGPTAPYAERFIGGRGLAAALYRETAPPEASAFDPENCIVYASGPAAGINKIAGSRWKICGKSPLADPHTFSYCNLGGSFGVRLKYAGFDALSVTGRAERPVYLYLNDGRAEIRDASHLWGKSAFEARDILTAEHGRESSVLVIGPAGENRVVFSTILASEGASGSGGLGGVMGSKNLKAVVAAGNRRVTAADPAAIDEIGDMTFRFKKVGLFPSSPWAVPGFTREQTCFRCGVGCSRHVYQDEQGNSYKALCQASGVYRAAVARFHKEPGRHHLLGTELCDAWGLDTVVMAPIIHWLMACYDRGILTDEQTGLPLSKAGSPEFIQALARRIALREGFGNVLADGPLRAAASLGGEAEAIMDPLISTRAGEYKDYDPRLFITTALFLATEPRRPINLLHEVSNVMLIWLGGLRHDADSFFTTEDFREVGEKFWGGALAADFSTYDGKAQAARLIQDRTAVKESILLCDFKWPMTYIRNDEKHVGDPALEARVYTAITGDKTDMETLNLIGERIFNLQRSILLREGWGGRWGDTLREVLFTEPLKDDIYYDPGLRVPGRYGEIISRVGAVVERDKFEQMKDEYYSLRGWDKATGLPTRERLRELALDDVAEDLAGRGLLI